MLRNSRASSLHKNTWVNTRQYTSSSSSVLHNNRATTTQTKHLLKTHDHNSPIGNKYTGHQTRLFSSKEEPKRVLTTSRWASSKLRTFEVQRRLESATTSSNSTVQDKENDIQDPHKIRFKDKAVKPHDAPFNVKAARTILLGSTLFGGLGALSALGAAGMVPFATVWMGALSAAMAGLSISGALFLGFGATKSDKAHLYSSSIAALTSIASIVSQMAVFLPFHVRGYLLLAQGITFCALLGVVLAKRPNLRKLKKDVVEYLKTGELVRDTRRLASFIHHAVRQRLYGLESVQYHQADVDYCYWNVRDNVPLANIVRPDFALRLVAAKLQELNVIPKDYNFLDELRAYDLWEITSLKREKSVYTVTGLKKEVDEGLKHEIRGELEVGDRFVTFFAEKHISTAAPLPEGSEPVTLTRYDEKHEDDLTLSYRQPKEPGLTTVEVVADALNQMEGYKFKVLCVESNMGNKRISAPLSTPGRRVYKNYAVQRGRYKSLKNLVAE